MQVESGKFYFIKDEFFELFKNYELMQNKENENQKPCYFCFKDTENPNIIWFVPISSKVEKYKRIYDNKIKNRKKVYNFVFGKVLGQERVFLIQNMFPTTIEYIKEQYIKQNKEVTINDDLKKELNTKANRVLELVKAGNRNLVFPDIVEIEKILLKSKDN